MLCVVSVVCCECCEWCVLSVVCCECCVLSVVCCLIKVCGGPMTRPGESMPSVVCLSVISKPQQ